ncbi:MAG: calcineurin-like phosphoesterase C-terminal domain-containing protein, partial [Muribaculaceae bacterium]|nr:calcineurin-like phosphoesterase C-terminal domain-containing protein [Muribaculaceae bacterium]
ISTPGGYVPPTEKNKNVPLNFAYLTEGADKAESHSFALTEERQGSYVLLNMADMHLANRNQDISQFESGFIKDVNDLIKSYEDQGTKVYGITLGDQSWDAYWYENSFAIPEAMNEVYKIKCPIYNCMGNHDNNPYVANNNNLASKPWVDNVCPNYYSFNIGQAHYVILDNINYINNGAANGVIGDRSYNSALDPVQLEWFKKDLATVADKSKPLVICMHIALNSHIYWSNNKWNQGLSMTSANDLLQAVKEFTNVKVLTGHTHINFDGHNNDGTVTEHNIAAVCATWWWTGKNGYAGNHICRDGSPGGYGVWEVTGPRMEMYYKSIGYDRSYQFRTTDINQVHVTRERFAPNCTDATLLSKFNNYTYGYETPNNNNEVQICVFNYGEGWDIKVTENGNPLTVTRVAKRDPLQTVSYGLQRLNVNKEPTEGFCALVSSRIFQVTASSPTSTLEIQVTDNYGNVYTETMERPKAFHYLMK